MTAQRGPRPPKLAQWLLKNLANHDEKAAILGDLSEEYLDTAQRRGTLRAALWYWTLILISLPSFVKHFLYWSGTMFQNYLTVALRIIKRNKGFSSINVFGLSIGMAASILIGLFVQNELSFDRHHERAARIYRVCVRRGEINTLRGPFTAPPMAEAMKAEFPEIEEAVRLSLWPRDYLIDADDKAFLERGVIYADGSIFKVFTINFLRGDPATALSEPYSVVLTQSIARKYFGRIDPVGKTLHFQDLRRDLKITGVVEDCPSTSHFHHEMIVSLNSSVTSRDTGWGGHTYYTYILLKRNIPAAQLEAKFPAFVRRYWGAQVEAETGVRFDELIKQDQYRYGYFLEPLTEIHLNPNRVVMDQLSVRGSRSTLMIFAAIALIILIIACINFMNLSTARFTHRCREVGVRKVLGSSRRQLVFQFMGETVLLAMMALGLALALVLMVLPAFARLAVRDLPPSLLLNPSAWLIMAGIALCVGLLAGSYPAFFLSALSPIKGLQAKRSRGNKGHIALRRLLVIFQFTITIAVFFATAVMASQLRYLYDTDLGFNRDQVIVVHRAYTLGKEREAFKQELLRYPEVITLSDTDTLPGRHYDPNGHRLEGRPAADEQAIYTMYADHRLVDLLDLSLVEGRFFSPDIASDGTSAVVINQTTARVWGLDDPVGRRFHKEFGEYQEGDFVTIIGVVKDFHFHSLHEKIRPMIIRPLSARDWVYTAIKVQSPDLPRTLGRIERVWKRLSGGQPLNYSFLDADFDSLYQNEQRIGALFGVFTLLAVTVACLGLLGLVSFETERRTREIGIRKILGAGFSRIVFMLSREVLTLIAAAAVIASPLAYYVMQTWLQRFAFHITIRPSILLFISGCVFGAAFLSVGYRAFKAALTDPVEALRYE